MPRPKKCRRVGCFPRAHVFKPQGIPLRDLVEVYLPLDGFEALRLADREGRDFESAARCMGISRHTFGRILGEARRIVARALVEGCALVVVAEEKVHAVPARQGEIMKIAISAQGPGMESLVDPRFGRAAGFVVVDLGSGEFQYVENGASQVAAHGAGIQAVDRVSRAGAQAVLTGLVGPKAFAALTAAGITVFENVGAGSVAEAVERYRAGTLVPSTSPSGGRG